jgi:phosphoserine phosphatase RsbU/P
MDARANDRTAIAASSSVGISPTVLVVDDLKVNTTVLGTILQREGFGVLLAHSGPEARKIAHSQSPDIILLDVMMPEESGFETCTRLKADPATADIPILFVSAQDGVKDRVNGLYLGAVDYISKPYQAEEVLARVRVHLRIREANRALAEQQRARLRQLQHAQRSILVQPEELPEANFGVCFLPMEETGGDFYDVVRIDPNTFGYFIADVSGHGVGASMLTAAIKALVRQFSGPLYSPIDTMRSINMVLRDVLPGEQYLTACWVRWNRSSSTISVVSAGHPPLVLVPHDAPAKPLVMQGDPLGVFGSVELQLEEVHIRPGDRFYLTTDGVIESPVLAGGGRATGLSALMAECEAARTIPIGEAPRAILRKLRADEVHDDLLVLGVEVPS